MRRFIKRFFTFLGVILVVIVIGFLLPVTPKDSNNFLFSKIDKDSLLLNTKSPRLILIGGSNLSFGINGQMLKDSLNLNPINTAVSFGIGLKFMLDHTEKYIKSGDIIVISPEYEQYFGKILYGNIGLLRTLNDVSKQDYRQLTVKQYTSMAPEVFTYIFAKFDISAYFDTKVDKEDSVYLRSSFDEFGDVKGNLLLKQPSPVQPYPESTENFNPNTIKVLLEFQSKMQKIQAKVYVTYPDFQSSSFKNYAKHIVVVQQALNKNAFNVLGTPSRYEFPDSLMFNTPYHLRKKGIDLRTRLLIEDLKKANYAVTESIKNK